MVRSNPADSRPKRHRTAMSRTALSRPVRLAIEDELLSADRSFFDYGCGRGDDLRRLKSRGIHGAGWDPNFRPQGDRVEADVVNLGYVVNVIEDARERGDVIKAAWELTRRVLVVSARLHGEQNVASLTPFEDGWMTGNHTFQKFYEQDELRAYLDATLGESSVAGGPGVFYVFRKESDRQSLLAARARRRPVAVPRRRISDELFEQNQNLLAPLMEFFASRGRLPKPDEADLSGLEEAFGSVKKAWRVVLWATNEDEWASVIEDRTQDLAQYLALAALSGRSHFGELPPDLRYDVRAFYSTYKAACATADDLLFSIAESETINAACEASPVGKLTQSALYVHRSALPDVPSVLRVFEGAARSLIGNVEEGNVIKLKRFEPKVSYLSYPDFDKDPHPALAQSISIEVPTFRVHYRNFRDSSNPPILHRKELFVAPQHHGYLKFKRLTASELNAGLLSDDVPYRLRDWEALVANSGYRLAGHRLIRA